MFFKEKINILIQNSWKFVLNGPINNNLVLVKVMALFLTNGDQWAD